MNFIEEYAELVIGIIILSLSFSFIYNNSIDPTIVQINENISYAEDKSLSYSRTLSEAYEIHDQEIGRIAGISPTSGYNSKDTGFSRMYFRPEQFLMLPVVDTDLSSNPNVAVGKRTNIISSVYNKTGTATNNMEDRGLVIGADPALVARTYTINLESITNKQITYNSVSSTNNTQYIKGLALYPQVGFRTQVNGSTVSAGGFNITIDSATHSLSGKKSNSVIFTNGRVTSK